LLVEDHEPTRAALTRLLLRRQFEVTGASSMAEARSAIQNTEKDFDILISDIGLPDGSGYDLMAELRQAHDVEGIALTGYGMDEDVQRSHAAGFAEHLTKPVRIELLDQALAAVVQRG
jgi:CheY-like chemotaxis protein